jgi:HAD superfamily hydrolase (TIGR01509 family)
VLDDRLGRPIERAAWVAHRDRRKLELLAPEVVRPGVVELLDAADAAGVGLAVASSSPEEWVVPHLERLGLRDRFAHVATRTDVGGDPRRTKPAPDLYEIAVRRLDAAPGRSVALEDSLNGLAAAQAAGLRCVVVPGPVTVGLDFATADLVVASLVEVTLAGLAALLEPEVR